MFASKSTYLGFLLAKIVSFFHYTLTFYCKVVRCFMSVDDVEKCTNVAHKWLQIFTWKKIRDKIFTIHRQQEFVVSNEMLFSVLQQLPFYISGVELCWN